MLNELLNKLNLLKNYISGFVKTVYERVTGNINPLQQATDCIRRANEAYLSITHTVIKPPITAQQLLFIIRNSGSSEELNKNIMSAVATCDTIYACLLLCAVCAVTSNSTPIPNLGNYSISGLLK